MPRQITSPEALLDTAMGLVQQRGPNGITIDALARSAGVSKGAVLHHFRTKSDLMAALVERFAGRIRSQVAERLAADRRPGALIRALLEISSSGSANDFDRFMQAVLAASLHDPAPLAPMRATGRAMQQQLLADAQRGLSDMLLILARDGMLVWQMCGLLDPKESLAERLMEELRRRAAPDGGQP